MEQLGYTYTPYRCKLKLSLVELAVLYEMMGRCRPDYKTITGRAIMEFVINKRIEFARKLTERRKSYSITLNAINARCMINMLNNIPDDGLDLEGLEASVDYKIKNEILKTV